MADAPPKPTVTVSMSRRVNLENLWGPSFKYESAEVFVSISNVGATTTAAEIDDALDTGRLAWEKVRADLHRRVREMKEAGPSGPSPAAVGAPAPARKLDL